MYVYIIHIYIYIYHVPFVEKQDTSGVQADTPHIRGRHRVCAPRCVLKQNC